MPRALVLLAPLAEEMETTIIVDVLRRASIEVLLAGVDGPGVVECSRGVRLQPDLALDAVGDELFDAIVLPGGAGGAAHLADSPATGKALRAHMDANRTVAAICAAPTALLTHRIALGCELTSHPSVRGQLTPHYRISEKRVVIDGQLITSQGPGTSFDFALALVERLCGAETAARVRAPMMLDA